MAEATAKGHHSHGSGSNSSTRRNTTKHSKPAKSKSSRAVSPKPTLRSFLFVVNELQVDFERLPGEERPTIDPWLNLLPPQRAGGYTGETVGTVFRYHNGVIAPAPGYAWHRPAMGQRGSIVRVNQAGMVDGLPTHYKTQTVFACSPLLPMIVTNEDASLGCSVLRQLCSCNRTYDDGCWPWYQLHFEHRAGISHVNARAAGAPFVAGKDARWILALIPSCYQNTATAQPSRGLAGELPIILALIGFHGRPGRVSEEFFPERCQWQLGEWRGSTRASSHLPRAGESPRGLVVQVCADNLVHGNADDEGNEDECKALLEYLEYSTVLVRD
ncbi:hypothetical protein BT67DRAFT_445006 [Trichocladium antarcticum]|uniref:Uncharacterized protein n=1 Tax=Trichocladium antarcticum TaxID=1450529 RepID=A0AAN6UEE3_9PEZI|nr:hypothetical protein BT67DRAFT_445006 [Trichocladium antarcticum]